MEAPVRLALVWHMHQPSYRDPATGRFVLPWTRLHATKDYGDMVAALDAHPGVHVTFTLTPILLEQLDAIAAGDPATEDPHLATARAAPATLSDADRRFLLREFFHVQSARMLEPYARYRELRTRAAEESAGGPPLTAAELRDLQTWFHLAWVDPTYRAAEPIRALWKQGRDFTEAQKQSLLDWGVAQAGRIVPLYRAALKRGQIEIATVPYHHPILPLLCDTDAPREVSASIALPRPRSRAPEDAVAHARAARRSHEARFGAAPAGVWPSEGAVSRESLAILEAEGFRWAASDEETLARALAAEGNPLAGDPAARLRAWSVATGSGVARPLAMLFRDRRLSDLIGFTYMHQEPRAAAADFVARVRETAAAAPSGEPPIVTVILDGENCWESYESDGGPFLDALYGALEAAPDIEAVTVSEALAAAPPRGTLTAIPVGSWIRADLAIWVGHEEKNRGWTEIHHARDALRAAIERGVPEAAAAAARDSLHAAEASDWFWWYGDDHPTAHAAEFDRLFRSHVARVYEALGLEVPARLRRTLRLAPAPGASAPAAPYVRPRLDGRESDFHEWRGAVRVDPAATSGSMHQTDVAVRDLRYGVDEHSLYVRVTLDDAAPDETARLVVESVGAARPARAAVIPLAGAPSGTPAWTVADPGDRGGAPADAEGGAYVRGRHVEARLPFERFGIAPGESLDWRLALERAGRRAAVVPRDGSFRVERPAADRRLTHWSAT
ncbi:MAG TPA: glycoside hydrolase family 57 protein [Candidatus Eisenbacteria bacterium]|nr:glycoside hydrolase family 57 protein [Candidatus Eisenbacteria bacterium]